MSSNKQWTFEWIENWETGFSTLETFWVDLKTCDNALTHVFFSPPLVHAWVETYRKVSRLSPRFLRAENATGDVLFYPLVVIQKDWKSCGFRVLQPVGVPEFDYHEPLTSSRIEWDEFWTALIKEIHQHWHGDFDEALFPGIREPFISADSAWEKEDVAPHSDLTCFDSPDAYLMSLKSSLRGDVRRQIRRLEEMGTLEFKVYEASEMVQAKSALASLIDEHTKHWPDSYKAPGLHQMLLENGLSEGNVHLSVLTLDGVIISWHLGFKSAGVFYWYMPTYLPEYQNLSPGKVHLLFCINESINKGLGCFDLLKGAEAYKLAWANGTSQMFSMKIIGKRTGVNLRRIFNEQIKPVLRRSCQRSAS